jgi:hypothetical protein
MESKSEIWILQAAGRFKKSDITAVETKNFILGVDFLLRCIRSCLDLRGRFLFYRTFILGARLYNMRHAF